MAASPAERAAAKGGVDAVQELSMMAREVEQQQDTLALQIQKVSAKIRTSAINAKRNDAALEMLKETGQDAVAYQQVARLFILTPVPKLEEKLKKHNEDLQQEAAKLENLKDQLASRLKSVDAQAVELRRNFHQAVAQAIQAQGGGAVPASAKA
ncbi:mediator complex subunit MED11 [Besnoitia besnoiti]|uniref:Mediator complex subunit MED11 n=1 Tax=Besnoitia besnoiti TaxID=94643 RepID=A0A2A9MAI7_BESBE|nr:mediator complex subunit MED11 [Besnoitia besnoiti]PFH32627.1 mediator complex subunit MED11 [Besnoitia besnoiti]